MKEFKHQNFSKELSIINKIENFKKNEIVVEIGGKKAYLTKSNLDFKLDFDGVFTYSKNKNINATINGDSYTLKSTDFKEPIHYALADVPAQHTFDVDSLYKGNIKGNNLFKMFFFDNSNRTTIFYSKLETIRDYGHAFNCVRLSVIQRCYEITQYESEDKRYFIIENKEPVTLEDFKKDAYAIQKGIGFLIGYMPGGENYIFSGEDFVYQRLSRESLKSIYHPVTSNPYSQLHKESEREIAASYYGKMKVIPASVISELVTQLRQNIDFSVAMIFLMEVASLKSVVSMPGVFSVILESLANCIITTPDTIEKLISDKQLNCRIISDLNAVIDRYQDAITPEAEIKIRRRLNEINKPINHKRLKNAEKLRAPFDQLKIKLTEEDEKAIECRNNLLHGNILMNDEVKRTSKEIDYHMMYISAKLYTLLSKLILKMCGYDGYVINHSKFYEKNYLNTKEDYFMKI
jgi:hypothetical protein